MKGRGGDPLKGIPSNQMEAWELTGEPVIMQQPFLHILSPSLECGIWKKFPLDEAIEKRAAIARTGNCSVIGTWQKSGIQLQSVLAYLLINISYGHHNIRWQSTYVITYYDINRAKCNLLYVYQHVFSFCGEWNSCEYFAVYRSKLVNVMVVSFSKHHPYEACSCTYKSTTF